MKTTFPKWFIPRCEISIEFGGGWYGHAEVNELVKMTPEWNPEERGDEFFPRSDIRVLAKSIEGEGLLQFPVVNKIKVIDGKRRTCACSLLGWVSMPVIFRPDADANTFAELNANQKPHSVPQKIHTWLVEPNAVTAKFAEKVKKVVDDIGIELVRKTAAKRMNAISLHEWAVRAFHHLEPAAPRKEFLRKAVDLQFRFKETKALRGLIESGFSKPLLTKCIMQGISLTGKGQ